MMYKLMVFVVLFAFVLPNISAADKVWQPINSGIDDLDIRSISVFSEDDRFICAASANRVYFSENKGLFWREILSLAAEGTEINFLCFNPSDPQVMYVATFRGLYATKNRGQSWNRIFRTPSESANCVRWVTPEPFDSQKIYIGTDKGLYVSEDSGLSWKGIRGGLPHAQVRSLQIHPTNPRVLYLANTYGLFKTIDTGRSWKRIFISSNKISDEQDQGVEFSQADDDQNLINCIEINARDPRRIFIATGKGVYASGDAGEAWNKLPVQGLSSDYVNFLIVAKDESDNLYAATEGGVFAFVSKGQRWQQIYQGMTARQVRSLALDKNNRQLFAGSNRGVFQTADYKPAMKPEKVDTLKDLYLDEPTVAEVQEAALRYAEVVHPDRIKTLRRNAKLKALLPDLSVDYDKTINYDSGADRYFVGPYDWGFSFSWDIGDLVYSEQVRLIDSNARLMVQLRDDILNEVTRLYYQRRKLQMDLILDSPLAPTEELAKRLRLEELTANIDALTGRYFSRHLSKQNN
ncbi:MAG: hypothetical protein HQ595_03360 [Candidatus Omnitrophica bacterium]|nr:hypothetical protein [Candidatus Omnitrophota bacterium]